MSCAGVCPGSLTADPKALGMFVRRQLNWTTQLQRGTSLK